MIPAPSIRYSVWLLAVAIAFGMQAPATALVISEIHYNPPPGEEDLSFVEVTNDFLSPEDISGWAFSEGIRYQFEPGTLLLGGERLVVCANPARVAEHYGLPSEIVRGDFEGRLDSSGERLTLVNHAGVTIQSLRYLDRAPWPVAPDGAGHSLSLKNLHTDTSRPENWTVSEEIGGSPGLENSVDKRNDFEDTEWIGLDVPWQFRRGTQAFSDPPEAWRQLDFDDSTWETGLAGFGFQDDDDNTLLEDMKGNYTSVAIRLRFNVTEAELGEYVRLFLSIDFDDGFCSFLNGSLFSRSNCPELPFFDSVATGSREVRAANRLSFELPAEQLHLGENVLAIVGFNLSLINVDFSLTPRLILRRFPNTPRPSDAAVVLNELFRAPDGTGWVEIFSNDDETVDLSDWSLTDDPARPDPYVFPNGTTLTPGGFLVLDSSTSRLDFASPEVRLFLADSAGFVVAGTVFSRTAPKAFAGAAFAEGRFPDGGREGWVTPTATPAAPNEVPSTNDVVINEIFYHPPEERTGEFVELYNRGAETIDLGGFRFDKGIAFTFSPGVQLAPNEYLVVAQDPARIVEIYDPPQVLGPYDGILANGGELVRLVDSLGNFADEVRYYDGGDWSLWADGRGSSLELIDPRQSNDFGPAWQESDESQGAAWEEHTFTVPQFVPALHSELRMFLVERGSCLVDDVSITTSQTLYETIVESGEEWRYAKGTAPFSAPPNAWLTADFDDSSWLTGPSGFGFADDDDATLLEDMPNLYTTVAIRKTFELTEEQVANLVVLGVDFDDGFCAYVNLRRVASVNCEESLSWDARATKSREAGDEIFFPISPEALQVGTNVIAILGLNRTNAGDFSLIPRIVRPIGIGESDNLIPNGNFDSELEPWRLNGTHGKSDRTEVDAYHGAGALRIDATSKGDGQCNGVDIDTEPRMTAAASYTISFATRWLRGSSTLLWSGGFGFGPWGSTRDENLSANPMGDRVRMTIPLALGTPGTENSATRSRRELRGTPNVGPVLSHAVHSPGVPTSSQTVTFRVRATDADGVKSVRVVHRTTRQPTEEDLVLELTPVGDDLYEGEQPPLAAAVRLFFYYETEDETGEISVFPTGAPEESLVVRISKNTKERLHIEVANAPLNPGNLLSNQLVSGTVVHDGEVFYNVGMRYRGSPWGRPSRESLRLRFPKDHLFKGMRRDINISRRDRKNDGPAHFMIGRNGTPEHPAPASDYKFITARLGGTTWGTPGLFEPFDRIFIAKWFGDSAADDGVLLKGNGRLSFDSRCNTWRWDEASLLHRGDRQENYRFYFHHSINQSRDNWEPFVKLTSVLDPSVTDDATLDEQWDSVIDIESFTRTFGPRVMVGDGDALFVGNGHNGFMFWDPTEELWHYIAVDFGGWGFRAAGNLLGIRDRNLRRYFSRPMPQRAHFRMIHEYMHGYWQPTTGGLYLDALRTMANTTGSSSDLASTRQTILNTIQPFVEAPFRILTGDGEDIVVTTDQITLHGEAPVTVLSMLKKANDGPFEEFAPEFKSPTEWEATFAVSIDEQTDVELLGFNREGEAIEATGITLTPAPANDFLRGDVNGDGRINLPDPLATLRFVLGGALLACPDAADMNDSGHLDLTDAILALEFIFRDGAPPSAPFPASGVDPTDDGLRCIR